MTRDIKALFFDVDGTLVSFKTHSIPQSTRDAIHQVRQKGIKAFIATGRPMPFINNLHGLEYDGIMSVNGAACIDRDGKVIFNKHVDKADLERIIADSKLHPMTVIFASNEKAIVCNVEANKEQFDEIITLLDLQMPERHPIEDALKMNVMQMVAFFGKEDEKRIMNEVLCGCESSRWHPYFADCIIKGSNKGTGIVDICNYYGIELCEAMAFGDGGNDIPMIQKAGVGVAMGNASDEVKQSADIVTDSVDDDGIAKILNQL